MNQFTPGQITRAKQQILTYRQITTGGGGPTSTDAPTDGPTTDAPSSTSTRTSTKTKTKTTRTTRT